MAVINQDTKDLMDILLLTKKFSDNMFACLANIREDDLDPISLENYHDALELIHNFDENCSVFSAALVIRKESEIKENVDELIRRCDEAIAL